MLAQIAWRNLWRNRRRTFLSATAVAGGLAAMLAMYAMTRAMGDRLLEALTGSFMGHVQIHREGYRTDRQLSLSLPQGQELLARVRADEGVEAAAGRIYGFAHATFVRGSDEQVRQGHGDEVGAPVVALLGVEPAHERQVTDLADKLTEGQWLEGEADAVIGAGLARRHGLQVGDAILPTAVAATGAMRGPWAVSSTVPRVVGIVRTGVEEIDSRMVLLPLTYLSSLSQLEGQLHEVAIRAREPENLPPLVDSLRNGLVELRTAQSEVESLPATVPLPSGREQADGTAPGPEAPRTRLVGVHPDQESSGDQQGTAPGFTTGRFLARAEEIVLAGPLAEQLAVRTGDRIAVAVPVDCGELEGADCPPSMESFVVAGTFAATGDEGNVALVAQAVITDNIGALSPESMAAITGAGARRLAERVGQLRGAALPPDEVLPWQDIAPEVAELMQMMNIMPVVFFIILYIAVVLGIVNTMLMATFERTRELGLMRALGMHPSRVVTMVMAESALLSLVGAALGLALALPLLYHWQTSGMNLGVFMEGESFNMAGVTFDPMLWPRMNAGDIFKSTAVVTLMTTLAGLWPALRAARLHPTEALRHE
jgi:ABC-type lipoprotein release transport system permease subunit